jgi:hypothetical protein
VKERLQGAASHFDARVKLVPAHQITVSWFVQVQHVDQIFRLSFHHASNEHVSHVDSSELSETQQDDWELGKSAPLPA